MHRSLSTRLPLYLIWFIWLMACTAVPQSIPVTAVPQNTVAVAERPSITTTPTPTPTPAATAFALPSPTVQPTLRMETAVMPTDPPPPTATTIAPATTAPPIYTYCAAPDDTFAKIAAAAGINEVDLRNFNGLSPYRSLMLSQRLQLPPGSIPPYAWASPLAPDTLSYKSQLATGTGGIYLGANNRQMRVALTFDIGFNPDNLLMMAYLAERNAPSTFFLVGAHQEMVQGVLHYGHELANHSWTHADLTLLTADEVREEIALPLGLCRSRWRGLLIGRFSDHPWRS